MRWGRCRKRRLKVGFSPTLSVVNDEQFGELMDCLRGIASRLEAVEEAVKYMIQGKKWRVNLEDIVEELEYVKVAVEDIDVR